MKQYVRCKACGFIVEAGKEGDVCPACGVPKTAFEPYKYNISEKRKKLLELHIHPIILHFPQGFVTFGLFLFVVNLFQLGSYKQIVYLTCDMIVTLLPLAVMMGFISGLIDGKLRFKKVSTPILKQKILIGAIFIITSFASALLFRIASSTTEIVIEFVLLLVCNICAAILGKTGATLLGSKLPG